MENTTAEEVVFGDVHKVAEITGLAKYTLDRMRVLRPEESPPFLRIGKRVIYPLTGPNGLGAWTQERIARASGVSR